MVYTKANTFKYHPKTKEELQELLKQLIKERGNDGDFNAESSKSHKFLAGMLSELTIVNKPPDMLNYSHRF